MSEIKRLMINFQGSVATCLKYGGVVNNQIRKGLLLTAEIASDIFLNRWTFGKVTSKNVIASCTFFDF